MSSTLTTASTFYGAPNTARGIPSHISASADAKMVAYGNGNNVVVRPVKETSEITTILCRRHAVPVTCARLSPSGSLCASGDRDGSVAVFKVNADTNEVTFFKPLLGAVRDITWGNEEKWIAVCGDGRGSGFAGAYSVSKDPNSLGTLAGHTRAVHSIDISKKAPYRILMGGIDARVTLFEGPPFKLKHTETGFPGTVNCVRFSPDDSVVACGSSSNEIALLDSVQGTKVRTVSTDHSGTLFGLSWSPDSSKLLTCSSDKQVKLWDANSGDKVAESESFGTTVGHMLLGTDLLADGSSLAVSLRGSVTFLDASLNNTIQDWEGNQRNVVAASPVKKFDDSLVTIAGDNTILAASKAQPPKRLAGIPGNEVDIFAAYVDSSTDHLLAATSSDLVKLPLTEQSSDIDSGFKKLNTLSGGAVAITAGQNGLIFLLQKVACIVFSASGERKTETKLPRFDASSIVTYNDKVLIGGSKEVRLFQVDEASGSLNQTGSFTGPHENSTVSALTVSPDGSTVASGDTGRQVALWSLKDLSVLRDDLQFHSSRITSVTFSSDGAKLLTAGLDGALAVWPVAGGSGGASTKVDFLHRNGILFAGFFPDNPLIYSVGGDHIIKISSSE